MREDGAAQASKPRPVKTLPPLDAAAMRRAGVGSAEREARAAARGSTRIARWRADDRVGRAVLVGPGRPQVDRATVEPHAHPRVLAEPVDRPGARRLDPLAVEVEGARGGAGRRERAGGAGQQRQHQQGTPAGQRQGAENPWASSAHSLHSRYNRAGTGKVATPRAKPCARGACG